MTTPEHVAGLGDGVSILLKNGTPYKINGLTVYMKHL